MEISETTNIEVAGNGGSNLKDADFQTPGTIMLEGYGKPKETLVVWKHADQTISIYPLKDGTNSEDQTVLLHPRPTVDPNDPLVSQENGNATIERLRLIAYRIGHWAGRH